MGVYALKRAPLHTRACVFTCSPVGLIERREVMRDDERDIEKRLARAVESLNGKCLKFVSPGTRGVPDRIVIIAGVVWFVELKTVSGRCTPIQRHMQRRLMEVGAQVRVLHSKESVDAFIEEVSQYAL